MIRDAINRLLELAKIEQFDIAGRKYTSTGIVPVLAPVPNCLKLHTLSGITDYLEQSIDTLKKENLFIHVVSPVEVNLYGFFAADGFYERPEFLTAVFEPTPIAKNNYYGLEDFIINLQSNFVATETSAAIMKVIGNIKDERVNQFSDDGKTQSVTAKSGISVVESVAVPNPVTLKPFRTFPEVNQPESLFIFRMKQQPGSAPLCGLWEADNKQWKVEAIKNIARWLSESANVPIIA